MKLGREQAKLVELKANEIRKDVIRMLLAAGSGHSAGSLGMADVFATIYFSGILNWDPTDPWKKDRDIVILSCGHICPVWYATLGHTGAFSHQELLSLRKLGSRLQGHPHIKELPGVENSAGPLGQGISQAVGQAIAAKMDKSERKIYCIVSDGELQEGQVWEALMLAGKYKLDNLTIIIDRNNIQIDGKVEDVMPEEPLKEKLKAFNLLVHEIDGNDVAQIYGALKKRGIIIAHTIPGKGVEFMESDFKWHGMPPNKEQAAEALLELRTLGGRISDPS